VITISISAKISTENITHSTVMESYIEAHLAPEGPGLVHARENSIKIGIPTIAVSPTLGKFLSLLATMSGAQEFLELGTLGATRAFALPRQLKTVKGN
jgi:predicted O-methyltransferase YrrM